MKIQFCGVQGTGKTTLITSLDTDLQKFTNSIRRWSEQDSIPINDHATFESQLTLMNSFVKLFTENDNYISDRSLLDVVVYSYYYYKRGQMSYKDFKIIMDIFKEFISKNNDIIYCYIPIEFMAEEDGVRVTNPLERKILDNYMQEMMSTYGITPVVINGSKEFRKETVEKLIKTTKTTQVGRYDRYQEIKKYLSTYDWYKNNTSNAASFKEGCIWADQNPNINTIKKVLKNLNITISDDIIIKAIEKYIEDYNEF